jgi:hypothetical protein
VRQPIKVLLGLAAGSLVAMPLLAVRAPAHQATTIESTYDIAAPVCTVTDSRLGEMSGMAVRGASTWVVNDKAPTLYALDSSCRVTESVALARDLADLDVTQWDVEDLALGPDGWLWLADTGGNRFDRTGVRVIGWRDAGTPVRTSELTYPDGVARDVEALIVSADQRAVLVTKTAAEAAEVFTTVEPLVDGEAMPLRLVGQLTLMKPEGSGPGSRLVTGGAVAPNGVYAVLRTYTNAWEFDVVDGDVATALVEAEPRLVPLPPSQQGEAIAYSADGTSVIATTETLPAAVDRVVISRRTISAS